MHNIWVTTFLGMCCILPVYADSTGPNIGNLSSVYQVILGIVVAVMLELWRRGSKRLNDRLSSLETSRDEERARVDRIEITVAKVILEAKVEILEQLKRMDERMMSKDDCDRLRKMTVQE